MNNEVVLAFGDNHLPYQHIDMLKFLSDIKDAYKPTRVICNGDLVDNHNISYHEKEVEISGFCLELDKARAFIQGLFDVYPELEIVKGNHDLLFLRKMKSAQLHPSLLRSFNEIYEVADTWRWVDSIELITPLKQKVIFEHGVSARALLVAKERGCCFVQSHYHAKMSIEYFGNTVLPNWAMQLGSLLNSESLAMAYGKAFKAKPKIGVGLIAYGYPLLIPMPQNKKGRYTGLK